MEIGKIRRCGAARAVVMVILAGLLGACADQSEPAPVYMKSAEPVAAPPPPPRQIVVQRGQTLGSVAQAYHVPKSAIIAANGLRPPYELKAGARLTIPGVGGPTPQAMGPIAASPGAVAATPLPPPGPETVSAVPPAAAGAQPTVIPLDGPAPPKQTAAVPPPQPAPTPLTPPRTVSAPAQPTPQAAGGPAAVLPPRNAAAALPLPGESPGPQASTDSGQGAAPGRFPWPVRGKILASYGSTTSGGRNDGINIAAPRGTPVRAIDGGTVAYAGNEVKGYGNIVLVKHANGWISAYAHLDDVMVKPGETITSGQVIAKVGDSGGVTEPQLHFELRRGKRPVDPREFLAPTPSATNLAGDKTG
jgi:murein DD-endopeptidase MepM/ murein hydrolase activator NlpD